MTQVTFADAAPALDATVPLAPQLDAVAVRRAKEARPAAARVVLPPRVEQGGAAAGAGVHPLPLLVVEERREAELGQAQLEDRELERVVGAFPTSVARGALRVGAAGWADVALAGIWIGHAPKHRGGVPDRPAFAGPPMSDDEGGCRGRDQRRQEKDPLGKHPPHYFAVASAAGVGRARSQMKQKSESSFIV